MKAVRNDSEGKLCLAIDFYIRALEYFIPALECELFSIFQSPISEVVGKSWYYLVEEDQAMKDALKEKVCYIVNT